MTERRCFPFHLSLGLLCSVFGALSISGLARADEGFDKNYKYSAGLALGNFDIDTSDSDDPHLNELSYSVVLGVAPWRYLAFDAEIMHIDSGEGFDDFDARTSFGGFGYGASARLQWPLAEDFRVFLRSGVSRFELEDSAQLKDVPLKESWTQPMYGVGLRGNFWQLEYVNYGKMDTLYLEQIRAGLFVRF